MVKKTEIPAWMAVTEAKAVIEANGQNIYFTSLEDARKTYEYVVGYYKQHHREVDFKKPRLLDPPKDKEVTFIAVDTSSAAQKAWTTRRKEKEPAT
jgi:hypothetical protein